MKEYWQQRLDGMPALDEGELDQMIGWSLHLASAFPEAVDMVCQSPGGISADNSLYFYHELLQASVARLYPQPCARLLRHLLAKTSAGALFYWFDDIDSLIRQIATSEDPPKDILEQICEDLARLGYATANDLRSFVENPQRGEAENPLR